MLTKIQTHGSSAKKSPRSSPARPAQDATQQALIAKLASSRESWHDAGRYEPERSNEHPSIQRAAGAQILKSVPHGGSRRGGKDLTNQISNSRENRKELTHGDT